MKNKPYEFAAGYSDLGVNLGFEIRMRTAFLVRPMFCSANAFSNHENEFPFPCSGGASNCDGFLSKHLLRSVGFIFLVDVHSQFKQRGGWSESRCDLKPLR
jgi:hypothetical protein